MSTKEVVFLLIFTVLYFGRSFYMPEDVNYETNRSKNVYETGISN